MRVADRHDELADAQPLGVAELGRRQIACVGAQNREVGQWICADDLDPRLAAIDE